MAGVAAVQDSGSVLCFSSEIPGLLCSDRCVGAEDLNSNTYDYAERSLLTCNNLLPLFLPSWSVNILDEIY